MKRTTFLLLAATVFLPFAMPAPASPALDYLWGLSENISPMVNYIWFSKDLVLQSTQTAEDGGYLNTVEAVNNNETSWTYTSFGEVAATTTAVSFPTLPHVAFLLVNNLQPPNVTAIVPSTGEVVWSSASGFDTETVPLLQVSFDGQSLYLFTVAGSGGTQMTAFDAATGVPLFTNMAIASAANVTQCGPSRIACVVECRQDGSAIFWDGRSGATLHNSTLTPSADSSPTWVIPLSSDIMLLNNGAAIYAINTVKYALAWSVVPWPTSSDFTLLGGAEPYRKGTVNGIAAVVMSEKGVVGLDAATGSTLWNVTATSVCPISKPAPGPASHFDQFMLGPFPSDVYGDHLFSFTVSCNYSSNLDLYIVGAMSAADGALKWWRYISLFPATYPLLPLGQHAFLVISPLSQSVEFYAAGSTNSFGAYPDFSGPYGTTANEANGTAFVRYTYGDSRQFEAVEVTGV